MVTICKRRWPYPGLLNFRNIWPIATPAKAAYSNNVKNDNFPQNQKQKPASTASPDAGAPTNGNEKDFVPSADEVARRAYFNYVNEGSSPGRDAQHWLTAEAELIKERDLTRTHSFHNRT
jgi:Protein of unknown function (DUF2934)